MIYSPSHNCFFDPANTTVDPTDSVAVTDAQYAAFILAQSCGQTLLPNGANLPTLTGVATEPPDPPRI